MALSDCEKCFDTPCECGWSYRKWPKWKLAKMRDIFQELLDETHEYSDLSKGLEDFRNKPDVVE